MRSGHSLTQNLKRWVCLGCFGFMLFLGVTANANPNTEIIFGAALPGLSLDFGQGSSGKPVDVDLGIQVLFVITLLYIENAYCRLPRVGNNLPKSLPDSRPIPEPGRVQTLCLAGRRQEEDQHGCRH